MYEMRRDFRLIQTPLMVPTPVVTINTIFTTTSPPPNDIGDLASAYTFRNIIPITGGNLGRVRVTFCCGGSGSMLVPHASVGVSNGSDADTLSTPNELLFDGGSGFNITANNSKLSDWLTLTDSFTASDKLVVIFDLSTSGQAAVANNAGITGAIARFQAATASYNVASPTASYQNNTNCYNVVKIETGS